MWVSVLWKMILLKQNKKRRGPGKKKMKGPPLFFFGNLWILSGNGSGPARWSGCASTLPKPRLSAPAAQRGSWSRWAAPARRQVTYKIYWHYIEHHGKEICLRQYRGKWDVPWKIWLLCPGQLGRFDTRLSAQLDQARPTSAVADWGTVLHVYAHNETEKPKGPHKFQRRLKDRWKYRWKERERGRYVFPYFIRLSERPK